MPQQHADGNRLLLGMTLRITAVVLAWLGQAEPAAVLSGAFSAHYPPSIDPLQKDEWNIGPARRPQWTALEDAPTPTDQKVATAAKRAAT